MYQQPGYLIRRLHQRSTAEFAASTSDLGITQIQLSILLVTSDYPGIDATRNSELIGPDRTTIGQALQQMEEKGLIERDVGQEDKRTKCLVVTDKGQTVIASVSNDVPKIGHAILQGLTNRERDRFMQLLIKAVAANEGPSAVGQECREATAPRRYRSNNADPTYGASIAD